MKRVIFFLSLLGILVVLPDTVRAVSIKDFKLNGFFDLEYEKSYSDDDSIGDTKGSFDQVHFNILMEFPVSNSLTVKGHVEYEHSPLLEGGGGSGEINIEWSYLEYLLSNAIRLRGGKFITPFGIYNEIHDATPTYVSIRVPWEIYRADKTGGFFMIPKFSTGINLLGNYFSDGDLHLNYVIYIANGENDAENEAEKDENSDKAIGGRLMVSPITGANIGGSFFRGKKGETKKDHIAWVGSVDYSRSALNIRAEYASSELDDITEVGWYGEVSYRVRMVTPFIRYGTLDPDDDTNNDDWTELVYGINYEIQPNFVLKLENRQFGGDSNNTKVPGDYNEFGTALTIAF